ncbi:MAG: hypothetical protein AB8H80_03470 [Planctomycetota bacterium]
MRDAQDRVTHLQALQGSGARRFLVKAHDDRYLLALALQGVKLGAEPDV